MKSYGIDSQGNTIELKLIGKGNAIRCTSMDLVELHIAEEILMVICKYNKLKTLELNDNLRFLSCDKELFDYDKCNVKSVHIRYE